MKNLAWRECLLHVHGVQISPIAQFGDWGRWGMTMVGTLMHLSILCPTTPLPGYIGEKVGHLTFDLF